MTAPTQQQIDAGVAAAERYEGWEAGFIGETRNDQLVEMILSSPSRDAAIASLTEVIDDAGYGGEVSATMIAGVVDAVLATTTTGEKT